jgi:hypothetical protein
VRILERLSVDVERGRTALFVATGGAALTAVVYFGDYWFWGDTYGFTDTPQFIAWMLLACGQSATWAVLVPILARCHLSLRGYWKGHVRELALSTLIFMGLILGFSIPSVEMLPSTPFANLGAKIAVLSPFPIIIALAGGLGIWLVHIGLDRDFDAQEEGEEAISRYLRLRDHLRTLLLAEAALLSVSVIGTGAMRSAILAWNSDVDFRATWIVLYGAFFSVLLALAYLPTHVRLMAVGHDLVDEVVASRPAPGRGWKGWQEERVAVGAYLELQAPGTPAVRAVATILSPLLTGVLTAALGFAG